MAGDNDGSGSSHLGGTAPPGDSVASNKMRVAVQQCDMCKKAIRKMIDQMEAGLPTLTLTQVKSRISKLDDLWCKFQQAHLTIMADSPDQQITQRQDIDYDVLDGDVERLCDQLRERQLHLEHAASSADDAQASTSKAGTSQSDGAQNSGITIVAGDGLANIPNTWGEFKGDYAKWRSFRDRFESAIHKNEKLDPTKKFQYLLSAVKGRASDVMSEYSLTAANYDRAWLRLCEIYEDDYAAMQTLVRKLLQLASIKHASYDALRKLVDVVHSTLVQLENFVEIAHWDPMIVFLVIGRLDQPTYKAWESHRTSQLCDPTNGKKIPTWDQLKAFLDSHARVIMHADGRADRDESGSNWDSGSNSSRHSKGAKTRPTPYPMSSAQGKSESKQARARKPLSGYPLCKVCNADHALYDCRIFKEDMDLADRNALVAKAGLCEGCLKQPHPDQSCPTRICKKCHNGQLHNTLLCPTREAERQTFLLAAEAPKPNKKRGNASKADP